MSGDNEDMEAFLAEIELVHDKVSKLQRGEVTYSTQCCRSR
jgi:hypothetical protein